MWVVGCASGVQFVSSILHAKGLSAERLPVLCLVLDGAWNDWQRPLRIAAQAGIARTVVFNAAAPMCLPQQSPLHALAAELNIRLDVVDMTYSTVAALIEDVQQDNLQIARVVAQVEPGCDQRVMARLLQGQWQVGSVLRFARNGQTAKLMSVSHENGCDIITVDPLITLSVPDIVVDAQQPLETSDHFEAAVFWQSEQVGLVGRQYHLQLAGQSLSVAMTVIKYRMNIQTGAHEASKRMQTGDLAICTLATQGVLAFAADAKAPELFTFQLLDSQSGELLGTGWIKHSLRRAQNIHRQATTISRDDRQHLNGHAGKVIWFTGLSGSGKSTLANALEVALHEQGYRTYILDGDNVRYGLNKDLGFTDADRVENIRRIAEVAKLMLDAGLVVMTAFISPFRREREMAKVLVGDADFIEVFVSTTLEVCEQRDVKGLYKKARAGKIPNMTGINSPYESPLNPGLVIDTGAQSLDEDVQTLLQSFDLKRRRTL